MTREIKRAYRQSSALVQQEGQMIICLRLPTCLPAQRGDFDLEVKAN